MKKTYSNVTIEYDLMEPDDFDTKLKAISREVVSQLETLVANTPSIISAFPDISQQIETMAHTSNFSTSVELMKNLTQLAMSIEAAQPPSDILKVATSLNTHIKNTTFSTSANVIKENVYNQLGTLIKNSYLADYLKRLSTLAIEYDNLMQACINTRKKQEDALNNFSKKDVVSAKKDFLSAIDEFETLNLLSNDLIRHNLMIVPEITLQLERQARVANQSVDKIRDLKDNLNGIQEFVKSYNQQLKVNNEKCCARLEILEYKNPTATKSSPSSKRWSVTNTLSSIGSMFFSAKKHRQVAPLNQKQSVKWATTDEVKPFNSTSPANEVANTPSSTVNNKPPTPKKP